MYLDLLRFRISFALLFPYFFLFYIIFGIVYIYYPSDYVIPLKISFSYWFFVFFSFLILTILMSLDVKPNNSSKSKTLILKFNFLDYFIVCSLIFLHIYLDFGFEESIRHSLGGISATGIYGYFYYLLKPAYGLILMKLAVDNNKIAYYLLFFSSLIFLFLPSSALDAFFIFAFLMINRMNINKFADQKKINNFILVLIGIPLIISLMFIAGNLNKNIDLAFSLIETVIIYRAAVIPVSFIYFLENFFVFNAIDIFEIYFEVNKYRIETILGYFANEPLFESLNRFNFLETQTWDVENQPGSSPGILTSIFISPILFFVCIPVIFLFITYLKNILIDHKNQNLFLFLSACSPIYYAIFVSPLDFIFLLGGGQFFILFLLFNLIFYEKSN